MVQDKEKLYDIAKELVEDKDLKAALKEAESNQQYKTVEPFVDGLLCKEIAEELNEGYVSKHEVIWAIINAYNGDKPKKRLRLRRRS